MEQNREGNLMSIVEKARLFAIKHHANQKYGELPYEYHLTKVYNKLAENDAGDTLGEYVMAAGWLHDVLEDTPVTFDEIFREFGRVIARLVYACTDEKGCSEKPNRAERHKHTYPKLKAAGREAIAVKLADRIANVEHSLKLNHSMFKKYQQEYPEFKAMLRMPGELKKLWAELDVLMATTIESEK
jgi:guanosine-3',5'-bis(diphosphate) 3'-pyrophosphohydrolase